MRNFGLIREGYITLMAEGLANNDKAKIKAFKGFKRELSKNPIYKKQNNVYNLLENISDVKDDLKKLYLTEAIDILQESDIEAIELENCKLLGKLLEHNINLSDLDYYEKDLHESVTNYIFTAKTPKTFATIVESTQKIFNFTPKEKKELNESDFIPLSMIESMMVKTLTSKFPELNATDVKVMSTLVFENEAKQEELFNEILQECKNNINTLIEQNESSDLEEDLQETKDKLDTMKFDKETYQESILDLLELKELTL